MESTKYLLIGGGIASVAAAQAIRERDAEGRLILISADEHMPYDRPPLSKDFLHNEGMTPDDASSKFDNFYPDKNIDLRRSTRVASVDSTNYRAHLEDGSVIGFEKLLLATGSRARRTDQYPEKLSELVTLRSMEDALKLRGIVKGARSAVTVGAGFLGMEVTAQCASRGIDMTVIAPDAHPWGKFASSDLGRFLRGYYEGKGVSVLMPEHVAAFHGHVDVVTDHRFQVHADFALIAIGAELNLDLAKSAGIEFLAGQGAKTNEHLRSSHPDIFIAGDIAMFPDVAMDRRWHLEHHLNARWQGEVAGANMAGDTLQYDKVPYFFSDFFDLHMILRGDIEVGAENTRVIGDMASAEFVELYGNPAGTLRMGIGFSRDEKKLDPLSDSLEALIREKRKIHEIRPEDLPA